MEGLKGVLEGRLADSTLSWANRRLKSEFSQIGDALTNPNLDRIDLSALKFQANRILSRSAPRSGAGSNMSWLGLVYKLFV